MNTENLWWGYIHKNGSIQTKRYLDKRDLEEAYESPFVWRVIEPFLSKDREEALEIISNKSKI